MLTAHQRIQLGHVSLLIQLELAENPDLDTIFDWLLLAFEQENILEGNA